MSDRETYVIRATTVSRGLAVSKGIGKAKLGEGKGKGAQEAPGRHPQFRDCFSDDTLYTHGQQQPTHYGNDTCASIRINILMDTREGRRKGGGPECERHRRDGDESRASVWVVKGEGKGRPRRKMRQKESNVMARRRIVRRLW